MFWFNFEDCNQGYIKYIGFEAFYPVLMDGKSESRTLYFAQTCSSWTCKAAKHIQGVHVEQFNIEILNINKVNTVLN